MLTPCKPLITRFTFMPGICFCIISCIPLLFFSMFTVFVRKSGFDNRPCRDGFYIMDCIPEGSIPPPPIIEAACFMSSGLFNIYCIIGLFIMSPIPSIEGMFPIPPIVGGSTPWEQFSECTCSPWWWWGLLGKFAGTFNGAFSSSKFGDCYESRAVAFGTEGGFN